MCVHVPIKRGKGLLLTQKTIKQLPLSEQPEEIFFKVGPENMTDAELLAIILRSGIKGLSALDLSQEILNHNNGNILNIMRLSYDELLKIDGIGKVKAMQLKAVAELSNRIYVTSRKRTVRFDSPLSIADYYMESMRHLKRENMLLILLNTKLQLIAEEKISMGTENEAVYSVREIYNLALKKDAVNIILIHNHPSGDASPSNADIVTTKKLTDAGRIVGIKLIDHIIIGDNSFYSMSEHNMI
ncbi:MAG: DNA repair protein RadC [Lachnospiraceae bacterium]|nr:DNA repair protein RadC [Lachnospiraceae bacterium]